MWLVAILALYPHFQTAKQAEDAFHLVLENAPAVITTVDRAGVIISLNRSGAETLPGLTPGQCLYDVFPPGEDAKLRATVETVFRTARSAESETRLVGPEGIVFWYHNRAGPIRGGNANRVESVILLSTDITKRKIAEEKLRFFSTHDALTGLFNRAFFETEIERLQNGRQFPISIVVADVNRLKETNDLHGHAAGDDLLRAVAHVLRDAFRDDDVIARLGGDEFAIILNRSDELIASQAIERLRARIVQFNSGQTSFTLSLSVGSATAVKGDPLTDVIKKADDRMYEDKYRQKTSRVPE
jgi:diguanylate cyclase (GGDEF)-like protein/PAS domain S-box-containing protein